MAVGDDGVVEKALGQAANPDDLGEIAAVALDASDRMTASHITSAGRSRTMSPRPSPSLAVTGTGRVYLYVGDVLERTARTIHRYEMP